VSALRTPAIAALARDDPSGQMSVFTQTNPVESTHADYAGERLIAHSLPDRAAERASRRQASLDSTDTKLNKIEASVTAGRLLGAAAIGVRVGKVFGRFKTARFYTLAITETAFSFQRNQDAITTEATLDGLRVIRTTVGPERMSPAQVVGTYGRLACLRRDFRSIKGINPGWRPAGQDDDSHVRAHLLICMLAAYVAWHLRAADTGIPVTTLARPTPTQ
jgi:hypothetical protein